MVAQDADSCKQQALPNSGNTGGQLGGRTFLDVHTHTKQTEYIKKSTKNTQVDNIARISTSDRPYARPHGGGGAPKSEEWRPAPLSNFCNRGHGVDDSPRLHQWFKAPEFSQRC